MHPDARRPGRRWLRFLLAGIILAGIAYAVPVAEIWDALKASRPLPLTAALVILLGGRLMASVRTKTLTDAQGLFLSMMRIFEIGCASTLYGVALPGSLSGGVVRWYRFSQPVGNRSGALAVVVLERAVDFLVLAALGVLCWLADPSPGRSSVVLWALASTASVCLLINIGALCGLAGWMSRLVQEVVHRMRWIPQGLVNGIEGLVVAVGRYRSMGKGKIVLLFAVSVVFHGVLTVSLYLMGVSLSLGVSLISMGWIRAAIVLLTAIPITPSGLGVREVSLVLLLLPLGVSGAEAVAFSLLQLCGVLLVALIGVHFDVRRYWRAAASDGGT